MGLVASQGLQRLQNRGARIVLQVETSENTFQKLNWIKLKNRRIMHQCILVYKCINNYTPEYLQQYFLKKTHRNNTRRIDDIMLPKPKLELFNKSFNYSGPFYFTSFLDNVKNAVSLNNFKTKIFNNFLTMNY